MKSILAIQMPIKERLADLTRRVDLNAKETLVRVLDRPGFNGLFMFIYGYLSVNEL